jgi:hypothetical protein
MGGRKKKLRQQSSTSPNKPHDSTVFFVEASLGSTKVCDQLRTVGANVEKHTDHFKEDERDSVWLRDVGTRGWVVLMKDERVRHRAVELEALIQGEVAVFVLANGQRSGDEMAQAFAKAFDRMKRFVRKSTPPFIAKVYMDGLVTMWFDDKQLPVILGKLLMGDRKRHERHGIPKQ